MKKCLPRQHRSALAKFRGGDSPNLFGNMAVYCYTGKCVSNFTYYIENELHVLLHCPLYNHIRHVLFLDCTKVIFNFANMNDTESVLSLVTVQSVDTPPKLAMKL